MDVNFLSKREVASATVAVVFPSEIVTVLFVTAAVALEAESSAIVPEMVAEITAEVAASNVLNLATVRAPVTLIFDALETNLESYVLGDPGYWGFEGPGNAIFSNQNSI